MKVLLVDDSKTMRMVIKKTMKKAGFSGHEILEAADGWQALQVIESDRPDIILSDWNMPNMNGIKLLEKLNEKGVNIPFGFVTSEGTDEMIDQGTGLGAKFYLVKPFTPETFQEELSPYLS